MTPALGWCSASQQWVCRHTRWRPPSTMQKWSIHHAKLVFWVPRFGHSRCAEGVICTDIVTMMCRPT